MNAFCPAALAIVLAVSAATPALAAEPAVVPPRPVVLDTPPPPQKATQPGMENYGMAGISSEQKAGATKSVKLDGRQLGHGMGGQGEAKPAAKAPAKAKKVVGKKPKKSLKKKKRGRR
jgi:hypothetical protein